jgi:hypothetical protein
MRRLSCLLLLLAAVISACGSSGAEKKAAPDYAATPRKALESWVSAVREGDIEMMCRLRTPHNRACDKRLVESLLPSVRAEMRGLTGELHYGAVGQGPRGVIGVVSGESSAAYAVKVFRGITQWVIAWEARYVPGVAPIVLERPDPATVLASGRRAISFLTFDYTTGSVYPNAELWIDGRHVNGHLDCLCGDVPDLRAECSCPTSPRRRGAPRDVAGGDLETMRWIGAARLLPGRHVMVAAVRGDGPGLEGANAWVLTVR